VALVRDHTTAPPRPAPGRELRREQLQAVLALVDDDLSAPLTVADLAARAHVSVFHFSRLFRASTGVSPHRYVVQRRLAHARELLTRTDVPIAQVAQRCGFADQSHLTRLVRAHLGCTPAQLRTTARGR
jgi:AraC family transcriptional regulator